MQSKRHWPGAEGRRDARQLLEDLGRNRRLGGPRDPAARDRLAVPEVDRMHPDLIDGGRPDHHLRLHGSIDPRVGERVVVQPLDQVCLRHRRRIDV